MFLNSMYFCLFRKRTPNFHQRQRNVNHVTVTVGYHGDVPVHTVYDVIVQYRSIVTSSGR